MYLECISVITFLNMTTKSNKLIILCKGNSVTGGSELIHQLCHELSALNMNSYVCYYPFNEKYTIPSEYQIYDVEQCEYEDDKNNIIILPEVATKYAWRINNSNVGIWWLSIDNYYRKKGDNGLKDCIKYYKDLLRLRLMPLFRMKKFLHFVQSEYAFRHLLENKIKSEFLSDYLNPVHFNDSDIKKENIILYNPVKGINVTRKLIEENREFNFIPLEKLNNKEVQKLFNRAKLYIDFGNHPGKDRMPREAVMANCCIITGKRGSASNSIDIPISEKYKFNDSMPVNNSSFKALVTDIFNNYEKNFESFKNYKELIKNEKQVFQKQVKKIFMRILNVR